MADKRSWLERKNIIETKISICKRKIKLDVLFCFLFLIGIFCFFKSNIMISAIFSFLSGYFYLSLWSRLSTLKNLNQKLSQINKEYPY